jgi:hypothetical protein
MELFAAGEAAQKAMHEAWMTTLSARRAADSVPRRDAEFLAEYANRQEAEFEMKWAVARLGECGPAQTANLALEQAFFRGFFRRNS